MEEQSPIHLLLVILLPPLLQGAIAKTTAAFAGRRGPPLLQPYSDLLEQFQKGSVVSATTSWVFRAGPVVTLAAIFLGALLVPLGNHPPPMSFDGDPILFVYLLGLARFFTTAAVLDTGSSVEGMGAARKVTFACLAEPALFFGLVVLAKLTGGLSLNAMLDLPASSEWNVGTAALVLVVVGWSIVLLVENSRIPLDDPNTHLELTTIREVMVLDRGGPALGMIRYATALKTFLFGAMLVRVAVPFRSGEEWVDWGIFVAAMLLLAVLVGVVESVLARLRLSSIPRLLVAACVLPAVGIILLVR